MSVAKLDTYACGFRSVKYHNHCRLLTHFPHSMVDQTYRLDSEKAVESLMPSNVQSDRLLKDNGRGIGYGEKSDLTMFQSNAEN